MYKRQIQREYGLPGEVVLTMPILVGLDGERKMSKSLGNYIGITEAPDQMFGKLMSISDKLMWSYYELLTDFTSPVIVRLQEEVNMGVLHPMDAKMQLAHSIVAGFHGEEAAKEAADEFRLVYRDRKAPTDLPEMKLAWGTVSYTHLDVYKRQLFRCWSKYLGRRRRQTADRRNGGENISPRRAGAGGRLWRALST